MKNMNTESVISERGQVTLPKELRDRLGLRPGMVVSFVPSTRGILIQRAAPPQGKHPLEELFGILKDGVGTDDYLHQIRGKVE